MRHKKRILAAGGGTGGAAVPLFAIIDTLSAKGKGEYEFLFVGTKGGPERLICERNRIPFTEIKAAKFRRYWDVRHFFEPFRFLTSMLSACRILWRFRPDIILSVGGFVSVPFIVLSPFFRIPTLIHQQDIRKGLANRLMEPFASRITVTFQESLHLFPSGKTQWTGNPVRKEIFDANKDRAIDIFHIDQSKKIIMIIGGGTGSKALNTAVLRHIHELVEMGEVIHITGKGKMGADIHQPNYHPVEFLSSGIADCFACADVVVTRAGLSALTELSAMSKVIMVVPIPFTHQEDNAALIEKHKAGLVFSQSKLLSSEFIHSIRKLLTEEDLRKEYSENLSNLFSKNANDKIFHEISELIRKR